MSFVPLSRSQNRISLYITLTFSHLYIKICQVHISGLVQDNSISIANALEILQSCTKPLICITNGYNVKFLCMTNAYTRWSGDSNVGVSSDCSAYCLITKDTSSPDTVQTIQIGAAGKDFGCNYMVAPMTNYKVMNKRMCFQTNGTQDSPMAPQAALPDLTDFKVTHYLYIGHGWYVISMACGGLQYLQCVSNWYTSFTLNHWYIILLVTHSVQNQSVIIWNLFGVFHCIMID